MSRAIREAAGISENAKRFRKGVSLNEVLREHAWHLGAGLHTSSLTLADVDMPQGALDWAEAWIAGETTKGLLLTGRAGVGKTTMMSVLLDHVIRTAPIRRMGYTPEMTPANPVLMVSYPSYVTALGRMMTLEKKNTFDDEYDRLETLVLSVQGEHGEPKRHARLCCLDDIGREYRTNSGWSSTVLNDLMRQREYLGWTTCGTSNYPLEEWRTIYDETTFSFAHQAFTEVYVNGKDRRR